MTVKPMKKTIFLIISIICILSLCSCEKKEVILNEPDVSKLADTLVTELDFEINPEEIDGEVALSDYAIDETIIEDVRYFRVGSSVADEIAIFKVNDSEKATVIEYAISERLKYLKEGFSDYKPSEVPKIENAYTKTIGNVVFLVICNDTAKIDNILETM